jgi:hypothetical protein
MRTQSRLHHRRKHPCTGDDRRREQRQQLADEAADDRYARAGASRCLAETDASGSAPSIAAIVVIMIGRSAACRPESLRRALSSGDVRLRAKSIIMIAFF